jgi:hypothetical protein
MMQACIMNLTINGKNAQQKVRTNNKAQEKHHSGNKHDNNNNQNKQGSD